MINYPDSFFENFVKDMGFTHEGGHNKMFMRLEVGKFILLFNWL